MFVLFKECAAHWAAGGSPNPVLLGSIPSRTRARAACSFAFFKRGEVEVLEIGALEASGSGCDSRHRDHFLFNSTASLEDQTWAKVAPAHHPGDPEHYRELSLRGLLPI